MDRSWVTHGLVKTVRPLPFIIFSTAACDHGTTMIPTQHIAVMTVYTVACVLSSTLMHSHSWTLISVASTLSLLFAFLPTQTADKASQCSLQSKFVTILPRG